MNSNSASNRQTLIREAFRLEWLTIAWMIIEGAIAVAAGVLAHSITLVAFGIDSGIELISAGVLIWRLWVELRLEKRVSELAENIARKIAGALLATLAAYVIVNAIWSLWHHKGEQFSVVGLVTAAIAIPLMYGLSKGKLRVAEALQSRALRADAAESIACGYLSFVVVIGFVAYWLFRAWWIDAISSLAIVYFLVKEAREAWKGEDCCD
jgi:divalent metal cation (Fe/Co/Zn/Cd) transporter